MKFKNLLIGLILTLPAGAQVYYSVNRTTTLSGTAEVITVQAPSAAPFPSIIRFNAVTIDCTVACNFTLEINGSLASATSLAIANLNPFQTAPLSTAWRSSNSSGGTVIGRYSFPAGSVNTINLSNIFFQPYAANSNLTLRSSSITGTVDINIVFREGGS